jgi:hypothetical protein
MVWFHDLNSDVQNAIKWFAAEFKYLKELKEELEKLKRDTTPSEQEKDYKRIRHTWYYIGRCERRAERKVQVVIEDLKKAIQTNPNLVTLEKQIEISSEKLLKAFSFYTGDFKNKLVNILVDIKIRKEKSGDKAQAAEMSMKQLATEAEQYIDTLIVWVGGLEASLEQLGKNQTGETVTSLSNLKGWIDNEIKEIAKPISGRAEPLILDLKNSVNILSEEEQSCKLFLFIDTYAVRRLLNFSHKITSSQFYAQYQNEIKSGEFSKTVNESQLPEFLFQYLSIRLEGYSKLKKVRKYIAKHLSKRYEVGRGNISEEFWELFKFVGGYSGGLELVSILQNACSVLLSDYLNLKNRREIWRLHNQAREEMEALTETSDDDKFIEFLKTSKLHFDPSQSSFYQQIMDNRKFFYKLIELLKRAYTNDFDKLFNNIFIKWAEKTKTIEFKLVLEFVIRIPGKSFEYFNDHYGNKDFDYLIYQKFLFNSTMPLLFKVMKYWDYSDYPGHGGAGEHKLRNDTLFDILSVFSLCNISESDAILILEYLYKQVGENKQYMRAMAKVFQPVDYRNQSTQEKVVQFTKQYSSLLLVLMRNTPKMFRAVVELLDSFITLELNLKGEFTLILLHLSRISIAISKKDLRSTEQDLLALFNIAADKKDTSQYEKKIRSFKDQLKNLKDEMYLRQLRSLEKAMDILAEMVLGFVYSRRNNSLEQLWKTFTDEPYNLKLVDKYGDDMIFLLMIIKRIKYEFRGDWGTLMVKLIMDHVARGDFYPENTSDKRFPLSIPQNWAYLSNLSARGINTDVWASKKYIKSKIPYLAGNNTCYCTISIEREFFKILKMGEGANGSCLARFGEHFGESVRYAVPVNHVVAFAHDGKNLLGRCVFYISPKGEIGRMQTWHNIRGVYLDNAFDSFGKEFAKDCNAQCVNGLKEEEIDKLEMWSEGKSHIVKWIDEQDDIKKAA